jgi:predicted unusual protein kinase regulating ubiquinone biosynthesis (AarF/ABC1/UbiB family)
MEAGRRQVGGPPDPEPAPVAPPLRAHEPGQDVPEDRPRALRIRRSSRIARSFMVLFRLLPFVLSFLRDRRRWLLFGVPARRSAEHHRRRGDRLAATLASLGPTFIKLAQLFSARADIFPEPYLSSIGRLQDQVPADPPEEIVAVIERELGAKVGSVFQRFDRASLAAASLGQVHTARVDDREVVVKVLRPGVEEVVALDLDISFRILFWLNILFPNHHIRALTGVVREFSAKVREEMDFRREAASIARFRETFKNERRVRAPEVIERFTTRRVLVMERVVGTKVDRLHDLFATGRLSFHQLMETLSGLYLRMMMVDGFLHADPHPGNILVQDDGTIVLLDWGMVEQVPRWIREQILNMSLALGREDLDGLISGMYHLGMVSPEVSRGEIREAASELLAVIERFKTTNRARIQEMVFQIFDTFYTWPITLPQELVYFLRVMALLEGLAFHYDKNFEGVTFLRDLVRAHRNELIKTTGREPVAAARNFLEEAQTTVRSLRELVSRADREELRVRMHPRDLALHERFLHLQARRVLLSIFATATALISSILYIAISNEWLLGGGLVLSLILFILVFFIPAHLLENPLRHARGIRPHQRELR